MNANPYCDLIVRDSGTFTIERVKSQVINAAKFTAKGYDFEANYHVDFKSAGQVLFNLVGSHYTEQDNLINPKNPDDIISLLDVFNAPKTRINFSVTYNVEAWTAHLALNYIGSSRIFHSNPEDNDPMYSIENHIDAVIYANARGSYNFDKNLAMYLGIRNITDKTPQMLPNIHQGTSLYDGIGRSYYLGINYSF